MHDNDPTAETEDIYTVVRNHEDQYSLWRADSPPPKGWEEVGVSGTQEECLAHIEEVWTDMRPRSVREHLEWLAEQPESAWLVPADPSDEGSDLVTRLGSSGPVEVVSRPESTVERFREALENGYVHLRFTDTRGGTEVGVQVDRAASDWSRAAFDEGCGSVTVVGDLVLDFEPVRCHADIDLAELGGLGRLTRDAVANTLHPISR